MERLEILCRLEASRKPSEGLVSNWEGSDSQLVASPPALLVARRCKTEERQLATLESGMVSEGTPPKKEELDME